MCKNTSFIANIQIFLHLKTTYNYSVYQLVSIIG
nr:MAG TPA: hypothetical protein [Bacteriophage sp.]